MPALPAPPVADATRVKTVALAGNPNVGKTTLFNALTGAQQKVANYPGVTVERKSGRLKGTDIEVVDLPGTYSLAPKSVDERVAFDALTGRITGEPAPDVVVCVLDATNLERNLYLATQVLDLGLPTVVALNMTDAALEGGITVDAEKLSETLGVPVVETAARIGQGIDALKVAVLDPPPPATSAPWEVMPAVQAVLSDLEAALPPDVPESRRRFEALGALTADPLLEPWRERSPGFH
ncbi:FeoB small GTPase domain-containing protein, partial [Rubrivirga sp.]|uniref:FeoB small GTPase domain-containing protein n=1 Tax=Rubrivirga sp. TaxID=1885344 RepID=UPI003C75757C